MIIKDLDKVLNLGCAPTPSTFYFQGWATRNFSNNIDMFSSIKMIRRNKNMTMGIKLDLTQNS